MLPGPSDRPDTSPPGPTPYVSVIVTAHDRREFLRGAVESVLAQDLDPAEFEVLVVKILPDPETDTWLAGLGPRVRTYTDPALTRLGQKLAFGIARARGNVVCFLEDDDRYLPAKLATVAARFRSDATLRYFRNRNRCIDNDGRPLVGPYSRVADREMTLTGAARNDLATVDFVRHYGAEGNSSISVGRAVVAPHLERIARFNTSADWMLFISALAGAGTLVVGTQPLSEYRLHDSLSQGATQTSRQRLGAEIVRSSEILVAAAIGTRAERAARFLRGRGSVNWYLIDPAAPRPALSRLRDAAWVAWLRREPTFAIQIAWCALRFLAPRAASNAYWGYHARDSKRQGWHTVDPASDGRPVRASPPGSTPP